MPGAFRPGQRIGPYTLLEAIAQGGQGALFKARDHLGRDVALKVLLSQNPRQVQRFVQEARVLARLDHPNLPKVFGVAEEQGVPCLALELIEGEDLKSIVGRTGPDPVRAVEVLGVIARVLQHCHGHEVVHRDLKPQNILIEVGSGRPVLVDFGLARPLGAEYQHLSRTGETLGTPAYMAPEQCDTEFGEVGPWTDVYGLGAVLYFLLTGQQPFDGSTTYNVILKVIRDAPPDPREANPNVPAGLARLCQGAMAKTAAVRPPDMEAFAAALLPSEAGEPAPISAPPLRSRVPLGLVVGGGLVALLGGAAWWSLRDTPPQPGAADPAPVVSQLPAPAEPRSKVDVAALLHEAQQLILAGHGRAALGRLQPVLREDPEQWTAWQLSGEARWQLEEPDQALHDMDRAVTAARGRDPLVHITRCLVRHQRGDRRGARADAHEAELIGRRLLSRRPGDAGVLLALGEVDRYRGRRAEAASKYADAVRLEPKLDRAYHRWGMVLQRGKLFRAAEKVIAKWTQVAPHIQAAWVTLAYAQILRRGYRPALHSLSSAQRLGALAPLALRLRGKCRWQLAERARREGRPHQELSRQALIDFSAALRERPGYAVALRERGFAYLELGRHEEAIADLVPALAHAKKQGRAKRIRQVQAALDKAWNAHVVAARKEAKYDRAIRVGEGLLKTGLRPTSLYREMIDLYNYRTKYSEAAALADRAVKTGIRDYWVCVHGAHARRRLGEGTLHGEEKRRQYRAGIRLLTVAIRIRPKDTRGYDDRSFLYQYLQEWSGVVGDSTKWIGLDRRNWRPWPRWGLALLRLAQKEGGPNQARRLRRAVTCLRKGRQLLGSRKPAQGVKVDQWIAEAEAALEEAKQ